MQGANGKTPAGTTIQARGISHPLLIGCAALCAALTPPNSPAAEGIPPQKIIRVAGLSEVTLAEMADDLATARFVFFGEHHGKREHHAAQLRLLRELTDRGVNVAIAAEMFQFGDTADLGKWTTGELGALEFYDLYHSRWDPDHWALYADLFYYAQQHRIPLAGINIPREVIKQVAAEGFPSLPEGVRSTIGDVKCDVGSRYASLMGIPMFGNAADTSVLQRFCEAQLTWDRAMAGNLLRLDAERPGHTWLVLAGGFHAWKHGIPSQIRARSGAPVRVVLPSSESFFLRYDVVADDADYVWWVEEASPPPP